MKVKFNKLFTALAALSTAFVSSINFCVAMGHRKSLDINDPNKKDGHAVEMQSLKPVTIFDITRDKVEEINLQVPTDYLGIYTFNTGAEFVENPGFPPFLWKLVYHYIQCKIAYWMTHSDDESIYVYFGCPYCDTNPDMPFPPKSGSDFLKVVGRINGNDPGRYLISATCAMAAMREWGTDPNYDNFYLHHTCLGDEIGRPHVNNGHIYVIVCGEIDEKPLKSLDKNRINVIVNKFQESLRYCLDRCDRYPKLPVQP